MDVAVRQVTSRRDMRRFIELPLSLYAGDERFVPHLLAERRQFFGPHNPLFEFTDVAYLLALDRRGRPVGRITAHVDKRHNEFHGERTGFFGFFESVEDEEVAGALLSAAEERLRTWGMAAIRGPFNFSTNQECGFLADGFDRLPALMMPYTKRCYLELMARFGYVGVKDLLAYFYDCAGQIPEHLVRFSRRVEERCGVVVRPISMDRFQQDVEAALTVYNQAWARNWGFVPMTDAQFRYMARELKPIVEPSLALIAELEGVPVGFSLALPDYNPLLKRMNGRLFPFGFLTFLLGRRKLDSVRVLTMGVVPEHRKRGIDVLLIYHTFVNGVARGFYRGEFSWVLEDNVLLRRALERMGARATKTYRIFEKPL
jgi:GNAT superfamily N-acetyltransferase